jgi:ABC-type glycerol-3-phosphate transport system substrate-binding protein
MRTTRSSLFFAVLLALLLGACQGNAPDTGQTDTVRDLEKLDPGGALVIFWHGLSGADEERMLEMIEDFNNEWGITVVGEFQKSWDMLQSRIQADPATRQVPSLILTTPDQVAAFALQDAAVELSPYLESKWGFQPEEQSDFFPDTLAAERLPQLRQQLFSFPTCRSLQVLYYNVDWLKELDRESPPQTWDEFRALACAASRPADGLYGFEFGMDASLFTSLLATQDIALLNAQATRYTLGGQPGRAALHYLDELIGNGCAVWETESGPLADFGAGKIPFIVGWTDDLAAVSDAVGQGARFEWGLAPLPHTTDQALVGVRGPSLVILRTAPKEQLAAWLFVKWLTQPEQQARWTQHTGCFPIRRSALDEMNDDRAEQPAVGQVVQLLEEKWLPEPAVAAYPACRAEIERMLYAVTAGESVDQWFDDTLTQCNQALSGATP